MFWDHRKVVSVLGVVLLTACGESAPANKQSAIVMVDDAGDTVRLAGPAKRIISLIPSATETLIAIHATRQIVGKTRYDVAKEVDSLPSVGGGIDPSIETVVSLKPDLVLAWDNDKRRDVRNKLVAAGIQVFSLRTEDTADVYRGIGNLGRLTAHDSEAKAITTGLRATIDSVRSAVAGHPIKRVMFVVYPDPPLTAGPHTFVDELIGVAGGASVFHDADKLWPNVSMEEIVKRAPELLIVPQGEFKSNSIDQFRARTGWRDLGAVKSGAIATVPADLTQRPGPNIGNAARMLQSAIHPETVTK